MPSIRVLVYAGVFVGTHLPNLQSSIFEEYISISRKVNVTVIAQKIDYEPNQNLDLVKVSKKSIPIFQSLYDILTYSLATIKHRSKYDIVFVRYFAMHFLVASLIAKIFLKKKLVIWIAGSVKTQERKNVFLRQIIKSALEASDIMCAASENVVVDVEKNLGKIERSKLKIISEPINISIFKPHNNTITDNKILSVCRIVPLKGIEKIIKSLPFVLEEIPDVKFIHVGAIIDKKYSQSLMDLATNLGCEKSVEFQGPVAHDNLVNVYNSSKIFILTSKTEGQSLATQEALACGKPVIVTPVGAIPDYVKDGVNGFHLKSEDPKELAKIIVKLLKDDELREKIGRAARKSIEDRSLEETFVNELTSTFNKLLTN